MTDHESQLRDLLHAAVPDDASALDPQAVGIAARKARHRTRLVGLGAAAATLAVIGGVALVATNGPDDNRTAEDPGTTAPYDAPACPTTLPELSDATTAVDDLDDLTSVRLCPDLEVPGIGTPTLSTDDQRKIRHGMDALIQGLDTFRGAIATEPKPDPARCAAISVAPTRQSLQFIVDGQTVLVPASICNTITVEGHQIDGGVLGIAFLAALDQQRDDLSYQREYTGPLDCNQVQFASPVRPGRERLAKAIRCTPDGIATQLDDAQLADLEAAWQDPGKVDGDSCLAVEPPSYLVVTTDHGDVTRLVDSACGVLTWDSSTPGGNATIPTTLGGLGLE